MSTERKALATLVELNTTHANWNEWQEAFAAARAALAQPAVQPAVDAHELWAAAQLVPGEGIADGVARIEALLSEKTAQPAVQGEPVVWIACADRMPTAGVKVMVCYRNSYGHLRRTCAHYAPLHTVDASTWDEGEPDETEDGTFEPEGWWEEPVEIERVQFIADEVTHWMPLPAAPGAHPLSQQPRGPLMLTDERIVEILRDIADEYLIVRRVDEVVATGRSLLAAAQEKP